jgi:redox-sensing transcriptional repressor
MKTEKISEFTVYRLSIYLRCLDQLAAVGVTTVSSQTMARQFQLNSAQIRKDLTSFGEFGVRGVGYNVAELRQHLRRILGLENNYRLGIVGAGNMGMALADYRGLDPKHFKIVALFDRDETRVGQKSTSGVTIFHVRDLKAIVAQEGITIAAICVPAEEAQEVVDILTSSGVCAILNFAPTRLNISDGVKVKTVDLSMSFESLSYFLATQSQTALSAAAGWGGEAAGKPTSQ